MTRHLLRVSEFPLTLVLVVLSAVPWTRGYAEPSLGIRLGIAAALSVAIPHVCARILNRPFVYSLVASIIGFVVYSLGLVLQSPLGFADLARGFSDGTAQLLSNTLPLSGGGWVIVVPITACWLTGAVVGELAARTRSVGSPILVALAGFAASYAATAGGLGDENGWAALFLLDAGALLFVRRWINEGAAASAPSDAEASSAARDRSGWRPLVFGSATLAAAGLVGVVLVPSLSFLQGRPTAPTRQPPELKPLVVTPIADIATLRRESTKPGEDAPLFDITLDRPAPGYVAVAQLDAYDGDKWTYDHNYLPTGGRIPGGDGPDFEQTGTLDLSVSIQSSKFADKDWLPSIGRPVSVDGIAVRYDPKTASLVAVDKVMSGASYRMRTRSPNQIFSQLPDDGSVSFDTSAGSYELPPGLSENVDAWLRIIAKKENVEIHANPEFFRRVEMHLKNGANFARLDDRDGIAPPSTTSSTESPAGTPETSVPDQPPRAAGTSFAEIQESLLGKSISGTPEQFATLFAALARSKNIPARVVTGFRIASPDQAGGLIATGRHEVNASQAWTWVEVPVIGRGWVVVDPTPATTVAPSKPEAKPNESTTTTVSVPTSAAKQEISVGSAPPLNTAQVAEEGTNLWIVLGVLAVPTLVVLVSLVLVMIRARRRSKRRARQSPIERTIGAWHETLDLLYEADLQDLDAHTNTEVSTAAKDRFGDQVGQPVMRVGQFANTAIFRSGGLPGDQVDLAWNDVDSIRSALKERQTGKERVRTFLRVSPRTVTRPRPDANRN